MATSNEDRFHRSGQAGQDERQLEETNQDYYSTILKVDALLSDENEPVEPKFDVETLLGQLVQQNEAVTARDLFVLSDLSRRDAEIVRRDWTLIPAEQRRQLLLSLLSMADEDVTWQLGRLLRIAMEDSDVLVRKLAIEGLWEDVGTDLLGPLIQMLHNDPDEGVRASAAATLGSYVLAGELDEVDSAFAMRAEEALLAALHNVQEALVVQCRALESVAYSGETGVRQLIEDAYYAQEEETRISSLIAMGRSADTRWRGLVRAELQNPSPQMRMEAARACGELEVQKAEHELIELLADEQEMVRLAAIFALGRIGTKRARQALRVIAADEEGAESEAADLALEELLFFDDGEAIDALEEAEEDEDEDSWDVDPWDTFDDFEDIDFGSYEDD